MKFAQALSLFMLFGLGCTEDPVRVITPSAAATEQLVQTYWMSWQKQDWDALRATLSPDFQAGPFKSPEALVEFSKQGNPWREVKMVDAYYGPDGAAILYQALDSVTGARVEVSEVLHVKDGRIHRSSGLFRSTPPPIQTSDRPPATLKFAPSFPEQPDGPQWAFVHGAPDRPSVFFLKVPAGFRSPPHGHTSGYHGLVLEGVIRNGADLTTAPDLATGSYWSQKAVDVHSTGCVSETPCLSLIVYDGLFDVVPAK